jgi:lactoylglutathione lyase
MGLSDIHNIDHTVIFCTDLQGMKRFYQGVLGFFPEIERPDWITFRVGGTRLSLAAKPSNLDAPAPMIQLAFRVQPAAVDECCAELTLKGINLTRGPVDVPDWRHRAVFFADPEGNRLEIYAEV